MENIKLSKIYANAIFEIASENDSVSQILELLNELVSKIEEDTEFKKFLSNPIVDKSSKIELLNKLLVNNSEIEKNILNYLVEKNRIKALSGIKKAYLEIYHETKNELIVTGIFPTELSETQKEKLVKKLEKLKSKKIILDIKVDKTLVTGGIIKINDEVIDGSLKSQLEKIKESF
ncbi:ATP synthase F1 subunit delta [Oceanivirga miroungae]|uniref:ATP synthase subunit delta n=1 Tax=Oceanivirga miroungae TaxID=1130046 RepID=A0A6I8M9C2_9FUSO|nr:ATP synthase F1 subunit delta [Oceanivirga miroungae]VWL84893.1 ATP synthase F1 subunit delta [Oceanivirga miroungae]